ncbi:Uncharacterised protein [uncultured Butyricicoccus sp.]|nr:Uncharacterised protein [uncultured Butyricicoccus sp.]
MCIFSACLPCLNLTDFLDINITNMVLYICLTTRRYAFGRAAKQKNVFVLTQNLKEGGVEYDSPARDVSGKGSFFEQ